MTEAADFTERAARYSLFLVFAETELIETRAFADEAIRLTNELDSVFVELGEGHVRVRGVYDLTSFDASASVLIWLTSETVDDLQWAKRQLSRTQLLGDTLVIESILAVGVSELADEPRSWISLAAVSAGFADDEYEEVFGEGEIDDPDIDNLDEDFDLDLGTEPVGVQDAVAAGGAGADAGDSDAVGSDAVGSDALDTDAADADAVDTDAVDAEAAGLEHPSEENLATDNETTSLHAKIGIGPIRLYAAVEADDPRELVGASIGMLDSGLITVASSRTGRLVTPAELYEILR